MTEARTLHVETVTADAFASFGTVIVAMPDGSPATEAESALDLTGGTPRFSIMSLADKPPVFSGITRHRRSTQTLLSTTGGEWFLAVAPASADDVHPRPDDVRAFRIPAGTAVTLARGTWHSGPFFETPTMDFANLELVDTNVIDHDTYRFDRELDLRIVLDTA